MLNTRQNNPTIALKSFKTSLLASCAIGGVFVTLSDVQFAQANTDLTAQAQSVVSQIKPLTDADFLQVSEVEAKLGQLLFFDPVLSGNDNISCSTCHHPKLGTSDGLSLGMGEGGIGLAPNRVADRENMPEGRVPRNAPALFNLGALEYRSMFHDGRVEIVDGELRVPIEDPFFDEVSGVLATQASFPVLSGDEMAGHVNENAISKAVRKGRFSGEGGAWDMIAEKVAAIPEYQVLFGAAYPEIAEGRAIAFADISNAIAGFMAFEFRTSDSAFDKYLRDGTALEPLAAEGMDLFYGALGCVTCHAGVLQTDHGFHAMGVVQFGPGKTHDFERGAGDTGRFRVTGNEDDLYAFRTPSLRNVTLSGPYGHTGSHENLRDFIAAHATPHQSYDEWRPQYAVLPAIEGAEDWTAWDDTAERARIKSAIEIEDRVLSTQELDALMAFMAALEDRTERLGIPQTVPSGLDFERE